jgi:hypothetical protein
MFLKFRPLLYSLVFLAGLELIILFYRHVFVIAVFLLAFSIYESRKLGGKWKYSVLPAFFSVSSVSLLYLIALSYEQQIFVILASSMYYLSMLGAYRLGQYGGDKTAIGMNMAATASTIFFTYASAYGIYLNFLVPLYFLMIAYLIVTLLVSFQHFSIIRKNSNESAWVYSFVLALAMAELIWAMSYWPFGYLTTGTIALILYYVIWDVIQNYFMDSLSKKRVIGNMALFIVLISFILISAKWIPVI